MKNLTRYKKAVRAANKYVGAEARETLKWVDPKAYKRELKLEAKWDEFSSKALEILEELTSEEEEKAIDWLAENSFYGYHDEVC